MPLITFRALALAAIFAPAVYGAVVINEVMYHAPNDIDDLEYIELHNTAAEPADIAGWQFSKGIKFQFQAGAKIPANGYLVIARNAERFREFYQFPPAGVFNEKLSNDGERLVLTDGAGKQIDSVHYKDHAPWPLGPDGHSGSLERISPEADGENPGNWISSPLSEDHKRPMGTPGKVNAGFAKKLGPVISKVRFAPVDPTPGQPVTVQAEIQHTGEVTNVQVFYRLAGAGFDKPEVAVPMRKVSDALYSATLPGQGKDQLVRFRIQATDGAGAMRTFPAATEPRPALSYYLHDAIEPAKAPFAWIINTKPNKPAQNGNGNRFRRPNPFDNGGPRPPVSFQSAFVYFDPATRKTQLFDFIAVTPRKAGRKVHLYGDQPLDEMTTLNLIFEYDERMLVTEPMAYEVYRHAGMAAEKSYHVRTWVNGDPIGYQLLVEQPNKAFLRRNKLRDDGNLYKLLWYGQSLDGQHEKRTNKRGGHQDLSAIVKELNSATDRAQWEIIRKNFDVEEVATYFAVNMVLTHWDGFFNNYFTYHDVNGTGKWTMYPWDQDKTWGIVDGRNSVFYEMPVTFGMNGDRQGGFFGGRSPDFGGWWRPPGWFSGPLLANPYFRRVFLSRTKDILENVYTEKTIFPLIEQMGERMRDEVRYRAKLQGDDPVNAVQRLESHLQWLRDHLKKRREFLLAQKEIREATAGAAVK